MRKQESWPCPLFCQVVAWVRERCATAPPPIDYHLWQVRIGELALTLTGCITCITQERGLCILSGQHTRDDPVVRRADEPALRAWEQESWLPHPLYALFAPNSNQESGPCTSAGQNSRAGPCGVSMDDPDWMSGWLVLLLAAGWTKWARWRTREFTPVMMMWKSWHAEPPSYRPSRLWIIETGEGEKPTDQKQQDLHNTGPQDIQMESRWAPIISGTAEVRGFQPSRWLETMNRCR